LPAGNRYDGAAMGFHPDVHHRRTIRLAHFDYRTDGAYFVTVCTYERLCIFDDPGLKATAEEVWRTVTRPDGGLVDEFVIMPNHVHGIIWITESNVVGARQPGEPEGYSHANVVGARQPSGLFEEPESPSNDYLVGDGAVASPLRAFVGPPSGSLGAMVGSFKSATAKRINGLRGTRGAPVWQRNYYEHIIRKDADLARIRQYIRDNPSQWEHDRDNPANQASPRLRSMLPTG
jgi:REP element-mobilizing transposase RayT